MVRQTVEITFGSKNMLCWKALVESTTKIWSVGIIDKPSRLRLRFPLSLDPYLEFFPSYGHRNESISDYSVVRSPQVNDGLETWKLVRL